MIAAASNPDNVFDSFRWPQFELGSSRRESSQTSSSKEQSGLTSAAAIAKIDTVAAANGFSPRKVSFAQLLALNLDVATRIERGEPVTAPGLPPGYPDPHQLVPEDCIRPAVAA